MKIQIASDLHLESLPSGPGISMRRDADTGAIRVVERDGGCRLPAPEAFVPVPGRDVLVLAGDIGTELMAREFVEQELAASPVIYIPGNHEYYSGLSREQIDADLHQLANSLPGLHFLVTEGTVIDVVRFWGAPWYSDLWGTTDPWDLRDVHYGINDFWEP